MTLSELSVKRPVFITMVTVAIMVMGFTAYSRLPTDLYPDVSFPIVSVWTVYPGASPADVESQLSKKIEDAVVSISGLDAIQSRSFDGLSFVIIQFKLSTDLVKAASEVREKVAQVRASLPPGIKEPIVSRVDLGALPILTFSASGNLPIEQVRQIAEDQLKPALEQLDGVAEVRIKGGLEREVNVLLDQGKLEALKLSPLSVLETVRNANLTVPGGRIEQNGQELSVRTLAQFQQVDDIARVVVATDPRGGQVRLSDVAEVVDGHKDVRTMIRTNGEPAVALEVVKQTGSNTVTIAKAVKNKLSLLKGELPDGFQLTLLVDTSIFIEANAHEVGIALWFGGLMAVLIILLFMMDIRSTLISAVALPTSVIGTFFAMYLLGFSLNMMTLLGLSLAIGLLIDDAVVVRENIFKYLEAGHSPVEAAIAGTKEVQLAVLATTLTIVAVFVPVAFMDGIVGQFFKQFGLTVSAATLLSLWVAFTLDPMLSSKFSKTVVGGHQKIPGWAQPLHRFFNGLDEVYAGVLTWVMGHRRLTFAIAVLAFFGANALTKLMGEDFLTPEDRGQAIVHLTYPTSYSVDESGRRSAELEAKALQLPYVKSIFAEIGKSEESNVVHWRVVYTPKEERPLGLEDLKKQMRVLLATQTDAGYTVLGPPAIEGLGEWSPIMLHVTGPDLEQLRELNRMLKARLLQVPGVAELDSSLRETKPDIEVDLHREALAHRAIPAATVGLAVRVAINGEEAGNLRIEREGGRVLTRSKEIPIRVRLRKEDRADPNQIGAITLPSFDQVKLGDVADVKIGTAPSVIERFNRERKFTLQLTPSGRSLGEVVGDVEKAIAEAGLPPGYGYKLDGDAKSQKESGANMAIALMLAVIFIYLVLAAQFESFMHPFTIMLSLPLAMVGAWLALFLSGNAQSLSSSIGVILLMGLVTKNAILLVDAALVEMRTLGLSSVEAIQIAGKKRLRPILMTSAAMVLGMLPTAFGRGAGSEFRSPMALAVIGGVITSTLLTLAVVPIVFVWLERVTARFRRPWLANKQVGDAGA